jgi:large conductance mechanosensitive channel
MWQEFKAFISRGNLIELAVAVILGLAFNQVVQAIVTGVFTPLIAAILGEPSMFALTVGVGSADLQIGLVIDTLITFLVTAWVLFLVVKAYNRAFPKEEPEAGPTVVQLLTEIRDELRRR